MPLLRRLVSALSVDKAARIDADQLHISDGDLFQIFRRVLRVCFDLNAEAGKLVVDLIELLCDLFIQAVPGLFSPFLPHKRIFVCVRLVFGAVDIQMLHVNAFLFLDICYDCFEYILY